VLSSLFYTKDAFGCGFRWQLTPLVGLLTFGGKSQSQKPNQTHPIFSWLWLVAGADLL